MTEARSTSPARSSSRDHVGAVGRDDRPVDGIGAVRGPARTYEAGLELQARSQWSYARMRFFRHRLALLGLVGLVVIFGAGIFANFVAPYATREIDLAHILAGPTSQGTLLRHRRLGRD